MEPVPTELAALSRAVHELARGLARRSGLGLTDLAALGQLLAHHALSPSDLSRQLALSSAAITALLDRLETRGLVQRRPHPTDRRRISVSPTPRAVRQVAGVLEPVTAQLAAARAALTSEEHRAITDYLHTVLRILREHATDRTGSQPAGDRARCLSGHSNTAHDPMTPGL